MTFLNRRWALFAYKGWAYWELQLGFLVFQYRRTPSSERAIWHDAFMHACGQPRFIVWQDKVRR